MNYKDTNAKLTDYRRRITELRQQMRETQASVEPEAVKDYEFAAARGSVKLSELFGSKRDLIMVHSMGVKCAYCTLWADGYNGIYEHIAQRAAFAISSPDAPEVQRSFAESRSWRFPIVSHKGTSFAADMGYQSEDGRYIPGISVFRKERGQIVRVSDARSEPGDDFCTLWHLFDLMPDGATGFSPKFNY